LKSYWFFHLSHLLSKKRIAQIMLCVKYVIAISEWPVTLRRKR
jgi:hypothetical protein